MISLLSYGSSLNTLESCSFEEGDLKIVVRLMFSKNILESDVDTVNVRVDSNVFDSKSDHFVNIDGKNIFISYDKNNRSDLVLTFKKIDPGIGLNVGFKTFGLGTNYTGNIIFECKEDRLLFKDIRYVSSID